MLRTRKGSPQRVLNDRNISPRIKELTERLYKPAKKEMSSGKDLKAYIETMDKEYTYKPYMYTINSPKAGAKENLSPGSSPKSPKQIVPLSPRIKEITERLFQPAFQPTTKWGQVHKEKVLQEKYKKEAEDVAELTFQPRLHTKHDSAKKAVGRGDIFIKVLSPKIKELTERLYSSPRSDSPSAKRQSRLGARLAQELAVQQSECTFSPDTEKKRYKSVTPSPSELSSRSRSRDANNTSTTSISSTTLTPQNLMSHDTFLSDTTPLGASMSFDQGEDGVQLEAQLVAEAAEEMLRREEAAEAKRASLSANHVTLLQEEQEGTSGPRPSRKVARTASRLRSEVDWNSVSMQIPVEKDDTVSRHKIWAAMTDDAHYHTLAFIDHSVLQDILGISDVLDAAPAMERAYADTIKLMPSSLEDTVGDNFMEGRQFRTFLRALKQRFQYWQYFKLIDSNNDQVLVKQEFMQHKEMLEKWVGPIEDMNAFVDNLDINHDGLVDFDEFCSFSLQRDIQVNPEN
jgi:hypothetical protein